ncbi:MAG: ribonuclease J [Cyanobacteria bacterium HKST-UBA02]|nr:ribonuclease J [Cyanobacteria bacterium HKST-UBA02]
MPPVSRKIDRTGGSQSSLRIIALGGLGEIGKNTMVIACGDDMMLVDAGLAFPNEDMLGVDLVLPDITFLKENADKIRGLAITHGHEDHIGGIPFILKEVPIPVIYGPALAQGLLESKLKEAGLEEQTRLQTVKPRQRVKIGCFEVEFIRCTHSIADSFSLVIRTPVGVLVHTGDFKFDFTPVDGELYDFASLARAAEEGILLLMSDSTNTERDGYTPSEKTVWSKLNEVFASARQRIIVTTFASNVHRVRQVLNVSMRYGRKVAILGRSMLKFADIARELGYMNFPDDLLVPVELVKDLPLDRVVILTTGSQGEPLSALTRIANDEHRQIKVMPGDTVIISATPIPGNERSVANTINNLFLRGADVVYGRDAGVHVSGHACREEQKLMLNICKPRFFMPIHGEYRMLVRHAELAVECGVEEGNTFVMDNGDVLEISRERGKVTDRVKAGIILIDSNRDWRIDQSIVEERRRLASDGLVTVVVSVGDRGKIVAGPDVSIRGVILPRGMPAEEFVIKVEEKVKSTLAAAFKSQSLPAGDLSQYLQGGLESFFESEMRSQPLVQVRVNTVGAETLDSGAGSNANSSSSSNSSSNSSTRRSSKS